MGRRYPTAASSSKPVPKRKNEEGVPPEGVDQETASKSVPI